LNHQNNYVGHSNDC